MTKGEGSLALPSGGDPRRLDGSRSREGARLRKGRSRLHPRGALEASALQSRGKEGRCFSEGVVTGLSSGSRGQGSRAPRRAGVGLRPPVDEGVVGRHLRAS